MNVDINDDELCLIVESLRLNEKRSREGFGRTLAQSIDKLERADFQVKLERAKAKFKQFVELRAKFGDVGPVKVEYHG